MQPPGKPVRPGGRLVDTIDELESLIGTRERHNPPVLREELEDRTDPEWGRRIPVLDELVEDGGAEPGTTTTPEPPEYSEEQITELIDSLEGRIAGELDKLLEELKITVTSSLADELRARLGTPRRATADRSITPTRFHRDPE